MPARRYVVSPQGGGPLRLVGITLPAATNGIGYSQNIAPQTSGGAGGYSYQLLDVTGGDNWFVTTSGIVTGTPGVGTFRVTDTGAFRITNTAASRIT